MNNKSKNILFATLFIISILILTQQTLHAEWKAKFRKDSDPVVEEKFDKSAIPDEKLIKRGRKIYRERCSACHGRTGIGNGPGAAITGVKVADLTNGAYMSLLTDEDLFQRIKYGEEGVPYLQMTPYKDHLSSGAIWSVIVYIRTLEEDKGPLVGLTPREKEENFNNPLTRGSVYYLRYCSQCHGVSGDGKGWAARISGGAPIAHNNPIIMAEYTRQDIYNHVKGLRKTSKERNMPVFGRTITPKVVKEISVFTKTLHENRD